MSKKAETLGSKKVAPSTRGQGPEIAYRFLQNQIMSLELKPGTRIDEKALVETLGLSRTPIRQALQRLASEGLLEILPNRGARVSPLDIEDARSFFEAFEVLQIITNHLAARRRDKNGMTEIERAHSQYDRAAKDLDLQEMIEANKAFHQAIARAGQNGHFERLMNDLLTKANRFEGVWHTHQDRAYFSRIIERSRQEHDAILEAIQAQNPSVAEKLAHIHVSSFREPFLDYLNQSAAEEIGLRLDL